MALTAEQLAARENKITASFVPALMIGDTETIFAKWLELIGDPGWHPRDLADQWLPSFGSFCEPFIIDWHQRKIKTELTRRGEVVTHPTKPHVCCTLDCWRESDRTCLDVKTINAHRPLDLVVGYYVPQCIVQKACTGADRAGLLICHGGTEPQEVLIDIDADYEALVWQRIEQFYDCVLSLTSPIAFAPEIPPDKWRTINLDTVNPEPNWSAAMRDHLAAWQRNGSAAEVFEAAKASVKQLLPADVGYLHSAGIVVARNRAGSVSIRFGKAR